MVGVNAPLLPATMWRMYSNTPHGQDNADHHSHLTTPPPPSLHTFRRQAGKGKGFLQPAASGHGWATPFMSHCPYATFSPDWTGYTISVRHLVCEPLQNIVVEGILGRDRVPPASIAVGLTNSSSSSYLHKLLILCPNNSFL